MLVDGTEVLAWATRRGCAAGSFNTYNLETTRAIIAAAEAEQTPIFLAAGAGALDYAGFGALAALARHAAEQATVPVALHLDHADDLDLVDRARDAGFSSFMVDGSRLALADNIELLQRARIVVGPAALEAELGGVGGAEDRSGDQRSAIAMTDPAEASELVARSGIDSLAVAIGNAHGVYRGEPRLDLDRLAAIAAAVPVPLVLHGASGLADAAITACIARGVRKINVNTELRRALFGALADGVAQPDHGYDLPALFRPAVAAMAEVVRAMIVLFRG